jgi:signal transduction histidine kinase
VILGEARRLERLVGDLLDLARLDARTFRLDVRDVDLMDVAAGTVDGFQPDAAAAGVGVTVETSAGATTGVTVRGDPDRLAQVAANLVENALKFATTEVVVRVDSSEGWGWLVVGDDGAGIAPDDLPHVFERLYVASREPRRKETGSGLGLAIVRELVAAMGGHVSAQARDGGGTELVVALPRAGG